VAGLLYLTGRCRVRRTRRPGVRGQYQGRHRDDGRAETSGVTLGDVSEHGNPSTASQQQLTDDVLNALKTPLNLGPTAGNSKRSRGSWRVGT
jgi:hypothetical protein